MADRTTPDIPPDTQPAPHSELVAGANGTQFWKLTCFCGKRLLVPVDSGHLYGNCAKCGRRLLLPTQPGETALVADLVPVAGPSFDSRMQTPPAHLQPARAETALRTRADSHRAADTAADRLRPKRPESERTLSGHISAWPLAAIEARGLAAFVDLTLALVPASLIAFLASRGFLPTAFLHLAVLAGVAFFVAVLNGGILSASRGSVGKRLMQIVVRDTAGLKLSVAQTLIRAILKWLLIPGWILALFDPSQRTVHDRLCRSLVMKARMRR